MVVHPQFNNPQHLILAYLWPAYHLKFLYIFVIWPPIPAYTSTTLNYLFLRIFTILNLPMLNCSQYSLSQNIKIPHTMNQNHPIISYHNLFSQGTIDSHLQSSPHKGPHISVDLSMQFTAIWICIRIYKIELH